MVTEKHADVFPNSSNLYMKIKAKINSILSSDLNKKIINHSFWILLGNVISKFILLIATILMARYLGKEEYSKLKLGSKIQCKPIFFLLDKEWHIEEDADESDYENYEFVIIEIDEEYSIGYKMDYFGIGELEFVAFMNNDLIDF